MMYKIVHGFSAALKLSNIQCWIKSYKNRFQIKIEISTKKLNSKLKSLSKMISNQNHLKIDSKSNSLYLTIYAITEIVPPVEPLCQLIKKNRI